MSAPDRLPTLHRQLRGCSSRSARRLHLRHVLLVARFFKQLSTHPFFSSTGSRLLTQSSERYVPVLVLGLVRRHREVAAHRLEESPDRSEQLLVVGGAFHCQGKLGFKCSRGGHLREREERSAQRGQGEGGGQRTFGRNETENANITLQEWAYFGRIKMRVTLRQRCGR